MIAVDMKPRSLLLAGLMLASPLISAAQRITRSGIGYMGGPQAAMWRSELTVHRPVAGLAAGFYAPIMAGNRMEIQPELLVSFAGTAQMLPDGERSTLRSIEATVPVGLKFFLSRTFSLQAGAQGGYLFWAQADGQDVTGLLSPIDMGINVGVGLGTWSGLDITLRYYNGLSNMLRDDRTYFPTDRTLQATIGKRFVQFKHRQMRR